jgi:hypothetical protein
MANKIKTRSELKLYFVKNAIPTEGNFADLIDAQLNQSDDGVFKPAGEPLSVVADSGNQKRVLRFYTSYSAANPTNPDWLISLNPAQDPADPATIRAGFGIADGAGNTRLFIDTSTGNLGVGTNDPQAKLDVNGHARVVGNAAVTGAVTAVSFQASGAIIPSAGNAASAGITFPPDPFGGGGDRAWIRYHNVRGAEKGTLEIGISNDVDDHVVLNVSGNVGIGIADPQSKLDVAGNVHVNGDIAIRGRHAFRGSDPWLRLNQDGAFANGVHTPGNFAPMALNVGGVNNWGNPGNGNAWILGTITVKGAITPAAGNSEAAGIMFPPDPFGGAGDRAWIRYHNARGGEKGTLEIGIANEVDDHIVLNASGNVGIGITEPAAKLDVAGNARVSGTLAAVGNVGIGTLSPEFPLDIRLPAGGGAWNRFVVNTTSLWGDGNTQFVTIGAGGATGIMLANPHVPWLPAPENRASIRYGRSGGVAQGVWWDVGVRAGNAFSFSYNGTSDHRLWLDANGNVGIGTAGAAPSNRLTVRDGDIAIEGGFYRRLKIVSDQYWAGIELVTRQVGQDAHPHIDFTHGELDNPNFGLRLMAADNNTLVLQAGSGGANLAVSGAIVPSAGGAVTNGIVFPADPFGGGGDRAWIRYHNARGGEKTTLEIGVSNDGDDHILLNPSGNVGIGVTDPTSKLDVAGAYIAVRGLGGEHGYIGGDGAGNDVQVGSLAAGVTNIAMYNPAYGYMFLYARQYQNASDARLKKDIEPITGGLEKLLKLRSVSFQWKVTHPNDADRRSLGLVAQEVREVLPDAVMEGRDGMLTIDYNAILAMAVEGLKEQQSQLLELRNGLKEIQARLDKLAAPKKSRESQS